MGEKWEIQKSGQVGSVLQPDQGGLKTTREIFVLKAELGVKVGEHSPGSVEETWLVFLGPQPLSTFFCWGPSLHRGSTE